MGKAAAVNSIVQYCGLSIRWPVTRRKPSFIRGNKSVRRSEGSVSAGPARRRSTSWTTSTLRLRSWTIRAAASRKSLLKFAILEPMFTRPDLNGVALGPAAEFSTSLPAEGGVGTFRASLGAVGCPVAISPACWASTAARIPLATSSKARSRDRHSTTGLPSLGSAWSLPNGALRQSTGRRMIGITRAAPALCRARARFISMS